MSAVSQRTTKGALRRVFKRVASAAGVADEPVVAAVAPIPNKGQGVVALRDVPPWTFVGVYPGRVLTDAQYDQRVRRGLTTTTYAVEHLVPGHVLDPGAGRGLDPAWRTAIAPRINEPGPTQRPNVVWVWNLPASRVEMWTFRSVRAGTELTACYGVDGGYRRRYCTSCVSGKSTNKLRTNTRVEPLLHIIDRPGGLPRPVHGNNVPT